jgi:hypothetical protein
VTRYPVPAATLKKWRPRISSLQVSALNKGSDVDDQSSDEADNDPEPESSPKFSPVRFLRSSRSRCNESEDEVEQDVISISSRSGKQFISIFQFKI